MNPIELDKISKPNDVWRIILSCKDIMEISKVSEEEQRGNLFRCPIHGLIPSLLITKAEISERKVT